MTALIVVEGASDRIALEVFARKLALPVPRVLAIGGSHAIARAAAELRNTSPQDRLVGLVDIGERYAFELVLERVFACDRDLEDELIRALGAEAALDVIADQGELNSVAPAAASARATRAKHRGSAAAVSERPEREQGAVCGALC